jgi:hypothetical protein
MMVLRDMRLLSHGRLASSSMRTMRLTAAACFGFRQQHHHQLAQHSSRTVRVAVPRIRLAGWSCKKKDICGTNFDFNK